MKRTVLVIALLTLGGFAGWACGSDEADDAAPPTTAANFDDLAAEAVDMTGQPTVRVGVPDNRFEPTAISVDVGTQVVWENVGRNEHNVTPAEADAFEGVATADLAPGATHAATFEAPGTYGYFCSIHGTAGQGQRGVVLVE